MPLSNMENVSKFQFQSLSKFQVPCDICCQASQSKLPFKSNEISSKSMFQLIHIGTCGPYKYSTHEGCKYFLTIVDDYSRGTWTYILKTKSNAFSILKYFLAVVHR